MLRFLILSLALFGATLAQTTPSDFENKDEWSENLVSGEKLRHSVKSLKMLTSTVQHQKDNRRELPTELCDQPKESELKYVLYTRENPDGEVIYRDAANISDSSLNVKKNLKVLIHSWLQNYNWVYPAVKDYLYTQNVDVLVVDWSMYAEKCEIKSTSEFVVPFVGESVAQLLKEMIGLGQTGRRIHLIGFSHGAHIAGIAGRMMAPHQPGRISALDPLRLDVTDQPGGRKLLGGDAHFIDVIVTSLPSLSFEYEIGDVTFYPNGGLTKYQTKCGNVQGEMEKMICSHSLAYMLFHESLVSKDKFPSVRCESYSAFLTGKCNDQPMAHMGEYVEKQAKGRYFLEVNGDYPFDKGYNLPKPRAN